MFDEIVSIQKLRLRQQREAQKKKKKNKKKKSSPSVSVSVAYPNLPKKRKHRKRTPDSNWGGAREGAGRPKISETTYPITRTIKISEDANRAFIAMKKFGLKPSRLLSEYLLGVAESLRLYDRGQQDD